MTRPSTTRAAWLFALALPLLSSCSDDKDGLPPDVADAGDAATAHPDAGPNIDAATPDAGDGGKSTAALTSCLDTPPGVLAMAPTGSLTCDLVPPSGVAL